MLKNKLLAAMGGAPANYIEDVFSTYLYTGNGSTQTITNGIDLAGEGGLVWIKGRSGATGHRLTDTARGVTKSIASNSADAQATEATGLTAFGTTGFTIGADADYNTSSATYASWTFRQQPKFFQMVTFTGNGTTQTINHNLGSVPGCIIVKNLDGFDFWRVFHTSLGPTKNLILNETDAAETLSTIWNDTAPTSTQFTVGSNGNVNGSGETMVAYLFAHDSGGFGLSGTDNVISCGSFTASGTGGDVNLGYEPQWVMIKRTDSTGSWRMLDIMRGYDNSDTDATLLANTSAAETFSQVGTPFANGFTEFLAAGTYIYIAIRRGPMAVPESGTSVFAPLTTTGNGSSVRSFTGVGFPPDLVFPIMRASPGNHYLGDRLRGSGILKTTATDAEDSGYVKSYDQDGWTTQADAFGNNFGYAFINYLFRRAPSVFDVVCYTGTGGASQTFTHNLGVAPELVIVKNRDAAAAWESLGTALSASQRQIYLNRTAAGVAVASGHLGWNGTDGAYKAPTSSVVYFGGDSDCGGSGVKYVAYLFATCPGVSKVGSYTGTAATLQINCGFTTGARFVLIKRTDSTGDWYVWDSARGIVAGNDPYLLLNSTAAEVTSTDYVDTYSAGFEITSTAPAAINASGGTFVFLAIA